MDCLGFRGPVSCRPGTLSSTPIRPEKTLYPGNAERLLGLSSTAEGYIFILPDRQWDTDGLSEPEEIGLWVADTTQTPETLFVERQKMR